MKDTNYYVNIVEELIPFNKLLGIKLVAFKKGYVKVKVPFKEPLIGNFVSKHWHGGVLSAIIDSVAGIVAATHYYPEITLDKISTIDMRVDFLKPCTAEDLYAIGEIKRSGNQSILTKVILYQESPENIKTEGIVLLNVRNSKGK